MRGRPSELAQQIDVRFVETWCSNQHQRHQGWRTSLDAALAKFIVSERDRRGGCAEVEQGWTIGRAADVCDPRTGVKRDGPVNPGRMWCDSRE